MKKRKWLWSSLIFILVILCLGFTFFFYMSAPILKERKDTIQLAEKYAHLEVPQQFYLFNRERTYYTITGQNKKHETIFVTVPKDGDTIKVVPAQNGISEEQARVLIEKSVHPYKIQAINFGYIKDVPIWEVTVKNKNQTLSYYTLRFSDGSLYNKITNF